MAACGRREIHASSTFVELDPMWCSDCGDLLGDDEINHSGQGFGHYRRCCDCYVKRQRGGKEQAK